MTPEEYIAVEKEREACAVIAESMQRSWEPHAPDPQTRIAAAIRARSSMHGVNWVERLREKIEAIGWSLEWISTAEKDSHESVIVTVANSAGWKRTITVSVPVVKMRSEVSIQNIFDAVQSGIDWHAKHASATDPRQSAEPRIRKCPM